MKRKYILELDDKYLPVYKACEVLDIRFSELTELVCCKDCKYFQGIDKYCYLDTFAHEEGFCHFAERREG